MGGAGLKIRFLQGGVGLSPTFRHGRPYRDPRRGNSFDLDRSFTSGERPQLRKTCREKANIIQEVPKLYSQPILA
jgi:hypothetical protein